MFFKSIRNNILVKPAIKLIQNGGLEYAGYLAYLNIFSLFPLFIVLGIVIGMIADKNISAELIKIILSYIPNQSELIKQQIQAIINGPSVGVLSIASVGALWTTTSSLEGLRMIFNKIYNVKTPPFFISSRLLSILQFIIIFVILIMTIFGLIILPKILIMLGSVLHIELGYILHFEQYIIRSVITSLIIFLLVAATYYTFTNERISLLSVLPGSAVVTLFWAVSAKVMTMALAMQLEQMSLVYGSLGGVLSVMFFFYVANLTLLYGAEFNYAVRKYFR